MEQYVQTDLEADCHAVGQHAHVTDHQRSLTSFEITHSGTRGPGRNSRRACSRDSVNERDVYNASLQTLGQRPPSCSKEGLWPW
jgi:hypothetical protein